MFQALSTSRRQQETTLPDYRVFPFGSRSPNPDNAARVGPGTGRLAPDGLGNLTGTKKSEN